MKNGCNKVQMCCCFYDVGWVGHKNGNYNIKTQSPCLKPGPGPMNQDPWDEIDENIYV